eukprot:4145445-Alexandrium_andersonii.AAC.1
MSASLVGSEMCIRDSNKSSDQHQGRDPPFANSEPRRELFGPPGLLAPVSYTHLTLPTICSV